jgi:hypothetical protein
MTVKNYRTNLNCGSCVAAVKLYLDAEKSIRRWSVDTSRPEKPLRVEGDAISDAVIDRLVGQAGFKVLGTLDGPPASDSELASDEEKSTWMTYYPLMLVFAFIVGTVAIADLRDGRIDWSQAMGWFMGGFFVVFSFFKLLNLRGFAEAYQTYDVIARLSPAYGFVYPFIELLLGIAYLAEAFPVATNVVTACIMAVGLIGVSQSLLQKRKIRCACQGTVFNLPMSYVTAFEDGLMAAMAVAVLIGGSHKI